MAEPALYRMRWPTSERPSLGEREIAGRHDLPSTTYRNSNGDSGGGDTGRNSTAGTFLYHPGLNSCARRLGFAKIIESTNNCSTVGWFLSVIVSSQKHWTELG